MTGSIPQQAKPCILRWFAVTGFTSSARHFPPSVDEPFSYMTHFIPQIDYVAYLRGVLQLKATATLLPFGLSSRHTPLLACVSRRSKGVEG